MKVKLQLTGTSPLLLHNIRLANPLDEIAKKMKSISGKRKKTDDDLEELARLEFEGGLYFSDELGPYLPGANIEKALIEGGRVQKLGKQVQRALLISDFEVPILFQGPRTIKGLWADPAYRSVLGVRVGQARIMRTRPMFRDWGVEVFAELDTRHLNLDTFQEVAEDAGAMVGVGDYRPRYGRFSVVVES